MDRLELYMGQGRLEQHRGRFGLVVQKQFELAHTLQHLFGLGWNKGCVARTGTADPVLASPEFTRSLVAAPTLGQQHTVDLSEQPQRQRQPFFKQSQAMVERRNVVADFTNVIQRDTRLLIQFEQQQI